MPDIEALMAAVSPSTWTAVAAALALVVALVVLRLIGASEMVRLTERVIVIAAVIAAGWFLADRAARLEHAFERRALDQRSVSLTAQAVAPGSPLACLDEMAGETIAETCEQAVFAGPPSVAAAVSYTAARLAFLKDAADFVQRADRDYDPVLAPMRTALETDRFGLVAHVLSLRDSCTELQCDAFALLRDPGRVQANLKERTFDALISRHSAAWTGKPAAAVSADTGSPAPAATATPVSPQYDFPSAASIPPVSIMNPEPAPPPSAAAPPARPVTAPAPTPPRRPPAPRAAPPRQGQSAPVQIAPPVQTGETDGRSLR